MDDKKLLAVVVGINLMVGIAFGGYFGYQRGFSDGELVGRGSGMDATFKSLGFDRKPASETPATEPMPGDACSKEGETVLLHGGDGITCTGGKYVVTMIGPSHSVGAPCFGPTGADVKPDKFGMVCRDGKFRRAE